MDLGAIVVSEYRLRIGLLGHASHHVGEVRIVHVGVWRAERPSRSSDPDASTANLGSTCTLRIRGNAHCGFTTGFPRGSVCLFRRFVVGR
jgi:hypothetical protein